MDSKGLVCTTTVMVVRRAPLPGRAVAGSQLLALHPRVGVARLRLPRMCTPHSRRHAAALALEHQSDIEPLSETTGPPLSRVGTRGHLAPGILESAPAG